MLPETIATEVTRSQFIFNARKYLVIFPITAKDLGGIAHHQLALEKRFHPLDEATSSASMIRNSVLAARSAIAV